MSIFSAAFADVAVTAEQDVFELVAPADSKIAIKEIRLGQYTDAGDAAAELLGVTVWKGFTTSGSGGQSVAAVNRQGHAGAAGSTTTIERNNTTRAQDGTGVLLHADAWNTQVPYLWMADTPDRIVIPVGGRVVIRITAPADSITMNGTVLFEEIGQ